MRSIKSITLQEVQDLEERVKANVRLHGYGLPDICPIDEIECFSVELSRADVDRVFLIWEKDCVPHTKNWSCRITELLDTAAAMSMERMPHGAENTLDLSHHESLPPVLVTSDVYNGPLVTVDGNHRIVAHYTRVGCLDGARVIAASHPNMLQWLFIPPTAKELDT